MVSRSSRQADPIVLMLTTERLRQELTQGEAARRMLIGQEYLARIENAEVEPTLRDIRLYSRALGVMIRHEVEELAEIHEEQPEDEHCATCQCRNTECQKNPWCKRLWGHSGNCSSVRDPSFAERGW